MITATVNTPDVNFDVVVLAERMDDGFLLCEDIDSGWMVPRVRSKFWVNPDYVDFD